MGREIPLQIFMVDIDNLLTENRIFKQRNADIGVVTEQDIHAVRLLRQALVEHAPNGAVDVVGHVDFAAPVLHQFLVQGRQQLLRAGLHHLPLFVGQPGRAG